MDLKLGPRHVELRDEICSFLEESWPQDFRGSSSPPPETVRSFRAAAIERGYLYRSIPKAYGGSEQPFDPVAEEIIEEEFTKAQAPQGIVGQGPDMVVPTLLRSGSELQRQEFIAPTLLGDIVWCQGYSEPAAGSDLASLTSRAELDGDEWVVNGHKVWTSDAHRAHWMFGLFRTEPEVPRSGGLSFLLVPMDQPGVEVQIIKAMTGKPEFCEVFFNDARTSIRHTVGQRGDGWQVSRDLLVHERNLMGFRSQQLFQSILDLARTTAIDGRPAIEHPATRRTLVDLEAELMANRFTRLRSLTNAQRGTDDPYGQLAATTKKLSSSNLFGRLVQVGLDLAGADESLRAPTEGSVDLGQANEPGGWAMNYLHSHAVALGGGAPNIQRNIIGERGLGMPRDLREGVRTP